MIDKFKNIFTIPELQLSRIPKSLP